jgi:hypothetical protein
MVCSTQGGVRNPTGKWIKDNSAVCDITGYAVDKMTKDKLYQSALDLYKHKEIMEKHLSTITNELFDLQDRIMLYDLTNTYFEGTKSNSQLVSMAAAKKSAVMPNWLYWQWSST